MYSDMSLAPFTQPPNAMVFILNIDPSPDGKSTITISHPDSSFAFDSVTIPIRIDEMTSWESDMIQGSGELAQGVTISGSVWDPEVPDTLFGAGAIVTLTWENGTVIATTLTDAGSVFTFNHVPSMLPVYMKTSHAGTGYVPLNTAVFAAYESTNFLDIGWPLVAESVALEAVNLLPGISEPAWNDTLRSMNWFVLFATEAIWGEQKVAGVTLFTDAPGAVIYYWDDAADMYTSNGPSRGYTTSEMGPQILGYAPGSSSGIYSFTTTGTITESYDGVLVPGEILQWGLQQ
jgi:hypothetical protein